MTSTNAAYLLAMLAFVLMAIIGILDETIPLSKIFIRCFGAIVIFIILGKIYSNIGRDLFREAINDARAKRNEQAEATRDLLEGDSELKGLQEEQDKA